MGHSSLLKRTIAPRLFSENAHGLEGWPTTAKVGASPRGFWRSVSGLREVPAKAGTGRIGGHGGFAAFAHPTQYSKVVHRRRPHPRCRMAPMGKKLTEAQIERYRRDGFVYPVDAFGDSARSA